MCLKKLLNYVTVIAGLNIIFSVIYNLKLQGAIYLNC